MISRKDPGCCHLSGLTSAQSSFGVNIVTDGSMCGGQALASYAFIDEITMVITDDCAPIDFIKGHKEMGIVVQFTCELIICPKLLLLYASQKQICEDIDRIFRVGD